MQSMLLAVGGEVLGMVFGDWRAIWNWKIVDIWIHLCVIGGDAALSYMGSVSASFVLRLKQLT